MPAPPAAPLSILLVEDSPDDVFFFLRSALKVGVNTVRHVEDGERAKLLLSGAHQTAGSEASVLPSIIVTDLKMPRCDGIQLLTWMRAYPKTKDIPVVVLSSSPLARDQERAYAAGANAYLVKPLDPSEYETLWKSIQSIASSPMRDEMRGKET